MHSDTFSRPGFLPAVYSQGVYRVFPTIFLQIVAACILLPYVPTLATNYFASQAAGMPLDCERARNSKQGEPTACIEAHSTAVLWSTAVSFTSNIGLSFFLSPVFGRWSDELGRKPFMLLSNITNALPLVALQGFLAGMLPFQSFYVANAIAAGLISSTGIALALVADLLPGGLAEYRGPAYGLVLSCFSLGIIFGPLIGSSLSGAKAAAEAALWTQALTFVYTALFLPGPAEVAELRAAAVLREKEWGTQQEGEGEDSTGESARGSRAEEDIRGRVQETREGELRGILLGDQAPTPPRHSPEPDLEAAGPSLSTSARLPSTTARRRHTSLDVQPLPPHPAVPSSFEKPLPSTDARHDAQVRASASPVPPEQAPGAPDIAWLERLPGPIRSLLGSFRIAFRSELYRRLTITAMLTALCLEGVQDLLLQYLQLTVRFDTQDQGRFFAVFGFSGLFAQLFVLRPLTTLVGDAGVLVVGNVCIAIQMLLLAFFTSTKAMAFLGILFVSLGTLVSPATSALKSKNAGEHEQGEVQGALMGARSIASGCGPLLFALLFRFGTRSSSFSFPGLPFLFGLALMAAATYTALDVRRVLAKRDAQRAQAQNGQNVS